MITFFAPIRHPSSPVTGLRLRAGRRPSGTPHAGSQDGFTLIEVVVSSLIVGIVTLGTFAGFDALGKNGADQRHHNEATVLAAQSQEALRSDPALALDELAATAGHTYTQTVQGTVYTIKQTAEFKNDAGTGGTCTTVAGQSAEASSYIRTSSSVRWSGLAKARPSVTETSLITPPVGSALEVDVLNGGKPELPVAGVTVLADGAETTTGEKGCVIYTGIPATTTEVEAYKTGYVTQGGAPQFIEKEASITPNVITHVGVILAQGSSITAKFRYNGSTTYTHENNKKESVSEPVKSDTFVAGNEGIVGSPKLMGGSTRFTFNAASEYATAPGTYEATATTPIEAVHYPTGDLFPFQSGWAVYAGDCSLNNPEKYGVKIEETPKLTAGANLSTYVPLSYVTLNLYKGTKTSEGLTATSPYPVKITNVSCTTPLALPPDDSYKATYEHTNSTTAEAHLTNPFQPFGAFKLCVYNSAASKTYTATYTNSSVAGSKVNIFLGNGAGTYSEGTEASKVEVSVATGQATNTC
jgi:prepilin-type N-terminal cleavage/methylation domain-containing protein